MSIEPGKTNKKNDKCEQRHIVIENLQMLQDNHNGDNDKGDIFKNQRIIENIQNEKMQDETKRRLMREGAVQEELNKLQGNSIYGAALPRSTVCKDRQRHPSPNQHAMIHNSSSRHIQVQTKDPQATIETTVMVGTPKIGREVVKNPRSQSIYGGVLHRPSGQDKHEGQASPFIPTCKQEINKCASNHVKQNVREQQDLSSIKMYQRNNEKMTYHMVGRQNTTTEYATKDPSDVTDAKKISNFLQSRGNETSTEKEMMSDYEKIGVCATGLVDGIECKNIKLIDGDLDVNPSAYPTGCPNNYLVLLN